MIKVLVVDDSPTIRSLLGKIINDSEGMYCVGLAESANMAREMIRSLNPDVVTLDLEMPGMNGLDFLERLMRLRPVPTIVVSSYTSTGSVAAMRALELGAVDVIDKPHFSSSAALAEYTAKLADMIHVAASAKLNIRVGILHADKTDASKRLGAAAGRLSKLIAIGASTGGTEAIKSVLKDLPANGPPVLIVQHMPKGFTQSFAERLNTICKLSVKEAEHGERLHYGCAYIAPGGELHLEVVSDSRGFYCKLVEGEEVNRHRPSVDTLFRSVAKYSGRKAIGVILTGMGKDGASGLLAMRQSGAWTVAQDEGTCVVFGMPKEAVELGAVSEICPLDKISGRVMSMIG
ncbi:protein-glutamate methylesterase/protein-glutamine glutaminase [Chromobacterium haemolyticum]|uniref:protein-glutamate methylesterase/protein-glutamine glutaminase n=1 Tax=Chromobacterium haemolyticum TaxID=394935 RepID=UPI0009D943D9|nr:chemotaxis response regulator protein-glutamate methylesterase [Chromobacterium haemolyticum]OQS31248.1 chemotaxis response regulator protein-glutamate methylesterase [Chromobacterium haemolyticum]